MADNTTITVNGEELAVSSAEDTPLLYVLTDELDLKGPRFGCGLAQCGSCSVLLDGVEVRSCITPLSALQGREITTLEGLPARFASQQETDTVPEYTPLQQALIDEQVLQCGYCFNGIIIKATELLEQYPDPDTETITSHMNGHLCRCGTYPGIIRAIQLAAQRMREESAV